MQNKSNSKALWDIISKYFSTKYNKKSNIALDLNLNKLNDHLIEGPLSLIEDSEDNKDNEDLSYDVLNQNLNFRLNK